MSKNQRMGLIIVAIVCATVAVVIATAAGGDDAGDQAAQTTGTTPSETQPETTTEPTTEPAEEPHETVPPEPAVTRIELRGGEVAGGPADIQAAKGDEVRIVVTSDAADDIHLHGYDIEKKVAPGSPPASSSRRTSRASSRSRVTWLRTRAGTP